MAKTIRKGDNIWVNNQRVARVGKGPQKATVVVVTDNIGKQVGVQFEEPGIGVHNCDGYGSNSNCLWVRATDVLSEAEVSNLLALHAEAQKHAAASSFKEIPSITVE